MEKYMYKTRFTQLYLTIELLPTSHIDKLNDWKLITKLELTSCPSFSSRSDEAPVENPNFNMTSSKRFTFVKYR